MTKRKQQIGRYAKSSLRELKAREVWEAFVKSGHKPADIPARPDLVYKNEGWVSWVDWLGWDEPTASEAMAEEMRDKIKRRGVFDTFVESDSQWKGKK